MKRRAIGLSAALTVIAMVLGVLASTAAATPPSRIHVKAVVVHKTLMGSGGAVVSLSAVTNAASRPTATVLRYRWDLTNDGVIETPLSTSPFTKSYYAPTTTGTYTATILVYGHSTFLGRSSVTFNIHRAFVPYKRPVHVNAVVLHKTLVASGKVMVSLSAITDYQPVSALRYRWDLTNDGVIETPLNVHPLTMAPYAPSATGTYTATVFAYHNAIVVGRSSVTFTIHRAVVPPRHYQWIVHVRPVVISKGLLGKGDVEVRLGAITSSNRSMRTLRYAWDVTTDGIIEVPASPDSHARAVYSPSATGTYTATVLVYSGTAVVARGSVTFSILRAVV